MNNYKSKQSFIGQEFFLRAGILPLEKFAYLGNINKMLDGLFSLLPLENWTIKDRDFPKYPVLFDYLRYSFFRLQLEHKLYTSFDDEEIAINTGLFSRLFEPIIMLFERNRSGSTSPWRFKKFVLLGELTSSYFYERFPAPILSIDFRHDISKLVYNIKLGTPSFDFEALVMTHLEHLPTNLLQRLGPQTIKSQDMTIAKQKHKNLYKYYLRELISEDLASYKRIECTFRHAVDFAVKWVKADMTIAVPIYYPKYNEVCFALPLCLSSDKEADLALIVHQTDEHYEALCILPLYLAYIDARLVNPVHSQWLICKK